MPGSAPVRRRPKDRKGCRGRDASLLTIGQYPTTVSASALQRVISLMLFFNAVPNQPSVKAMLYY